MSIEYKYPNDLQLTKLECRNCRYWVEKPTEIKMQTEKATYTIRSEEVFGQCRINPPENKEPATVSDFSLVKWPLTNPEDWCGKFNLRGDWKSKRPSQTNPIEQPERGS